MQTSASDKKGRILTRVLAALLPILLFGGVLAALGVYPFGEKSLLIIDLDSEYVDYLALLHESLRTGGSLLRSWNMGMGLGMLDLIAFYTASPLNLMIMLFPVEYITEALFAVTLLKLGLAGFLFSVFTEYAFRRRGIFAVIFSVAYAMNAYGIAYASNLMWLDGMAFLPLVITGVVMLVRENRWALFHWSLVYVFFTSYYIGYMIGAFSFLCFMALWLSRPREWREFLPKLARFFGAAFLAAGCCAFLLLPAFLGLAHGQSDLWNARIDFSLDKPFLRIASRLLPGVYDTLTDPGYPAIYCTALAVFLGTQFFLQPVAARREKVVAGLFLGLLFLSFSCGALDLAWHAFEVPTWFPARYSFVFPFLLLTLAMRAAGRAEDFRLAGVIGGLVLLTGLAVEIGIGRYRYVAVTNLLAGVVLPLVYALLYRAGRRFPSQGRVLALAALVLVAGECWANAWSMEVQLDGQFRYKPRESYAAYREKYIPALRAIAAEDTGVYRVEIAEQRSANGGMALGYRGISHYSTTTDQALNRFLRSLGYNKGTENELRFALNTPATNGLLGIKYLLAAEPPGGGYEAAGTVNGVTLYQNRCALPLAFWAPESAMAWQGGTKDPFLLQNELLSSLSTGLPAQFFTPVSAEQSLYNADLEQLDGYVELTPRVPGEASMLRYRLGNPAGGELFAFFPVWNDKFAAAEVFRGEASIGQDLRYRENTVLSLGSGEHASLSLELSPGVTRIEDAYFYALDLAAAKRLTAEVQSRAMVIETFTDAFVEGVIDAASDGCLATTFPYDEGWRVYVDGDPVSTERFAGVFLAVPVTAGEHRIVMRYWPPGFWTGCTVSAGCWGWWALWAVRRRIRAKKSPR